MAAAERLDNGRVTRQSALSQSVKASSWEYWDSEAARGCGTRVSDGHVRSVSDGCQMDFRYLSDGCQIVTAQSTRHMHCIMTCLSGEFVGCYACQMGVRHTRKDGFPNASLALSSRVSSVVLAVRS